MKEYIQSVIMPGQSFAVSPAIPLKDYWVPVTASLMMIILCLGVSPQRTFWNDEVFTWFMVADPSFSHMLEAFHDKLNNTPLLYFALGWGWSQLFGAEELSLRLFSCLWFCVAFFLIWMLLHKNFGFWPATIATLSIFMTSSIITYQVTEARMYGLFLALVAGAVYLYDVCGRRKNPGWQLVLATFLVHAALMHTHLFGMFYVAALLGASLLRDGIQKNWQPWIYGAIIAGGATFIFYYPAFVVQADAGNPRSWLPLPSPSDLKNYLLLQNPSFMNPAVFNILMVAVLLRMWLFPDVHNKFRWMRARQRLPLNSMQIACLALLAVPVGTWVLSYLVRPIHWDRYLLPTVIGMAILIAFLLELFFYPQEKEKISNGQAPAYNTPGMRFNYLIFPTIITLLFLFNPIRKLLLADLSYNRDDYFEAIENNPDLPIVIQTSEFLEVYFNAPPETKERLFFILDEAAASREGSGAFDLQFHKHMEAFQRQYPDFFKNQVVDGETFLKNHSRFVVIDYANYDKQCSYKVVKTTYGAWWGETHCPQWMECRILSDPKYRVTPLQTGFEPIPWPIPTNYKSFSVLLVEQTDTNQ